MAPKKRGREDVVAAPTKRVAGGGGEAAAGAGAGAATGSSDSEGYSGAVVKTLPVPLAVPQAGPSSGTYQCTQHWLFLRPEPLIRTQ